MQSKLYLVLVAGLLALVDALPIAPYGRAPDADVVVAKRGFFLNLFTGIEGLFSSLPLSSLALTNNNANSANNAAAKAPPQGQVAAAVPFGPTTTIIEYAQPLTQPALTKPAAPAAAPAAAFGVNNHPAAPVAAPAATTLKIQVFAPALTQPAAPALTKQSSSSSGSGSGFFDSLFGDLSGFFGLDGGSSLSKPQSQPQLSQPQPLLNPQPGPAPSSTQEQSQPPQPLSSSDQGQNQNQGPSPTSDLGGKAGSGYGGTGGEGKASGSPDDVAAVLAGEVPGWYSIGDHSDNAVPTGSTQGDQNAKYALGAKGISYSPYRKSGGCKLLQEVANDIKRLQGFHLIRLYSTDCSGIENVLALMGSSQQLFLGVWNLDKALVEGGLNDIANAVKTSNRGWLAVHTIAIGNERVNEGQATVDDISNALTTARNWLKANAASYNGAVVSVDTLVAVKNNPGLCGLSDYLAVNCHPYWDGGVQPENLGPWLKQQMQELAGICNNNKQIMITETGWPTKGGKYGQCEPLIENQKTALQLIMSTMGLDVLAFTMYNDYWKLGGTNGVEQFWGVYGDPDA